MILNRYHNTKECVNRLVRDFYKHNNIIIAVDYDNTLFNFKKRGYSDKVIKLLQKLAPYNSKHIQGMGRYSLPVDKRFTIMLYTAREAFKLEEAIEHCKDTLSIRIDSVNETPSNVSFPKTVKPFYNILLDDKAGLGQAYKILKKFLKIIDYEY